MSSYKLCTYQSPKGPRAGVVVTPRTLLYAKGEYVNTRLSGAFSSAVDTAANFSARPAA